MKFIEFCKRCIYRHIDEFESLCESCLCKSICEDNQKPANYKPKDRKEATK